MGEAVFLRKSSGVLKVMNTYDCAFFAFLTSGGVHYPIASLALYYGIAPLANWYVVVPALVVMEIIVGVAYAMLSAAMPRSGGDYVFQSRGLNPGIGFATTFLGLVIFNVWWVYFLASSTVGGYVPGLLSAIGVSTGNTGLMGLADWLVSAATVGAEGHTVFLILSLLIACFLFAITCFGLMFYTKLQRYFMFPTAIIAIVLLAAQYLLVPVGSFVAHVNTYASGVGYVGDYYTGVVQDALKLGFNPYAATNWFDTTVMFMLIFTVSLWALTSGFLLGEVKGVSTLKGNLIWVLSSLMGATVSWIIALPMATWYAGEPFMRSVSWLAINAPGQPFNLLSSRGGFGVAALVSGSPIVVFLIWLGIFGSAMQGSSSAFVTAPRIMFAASFDRYIPGWFGAVNRKGTPTHTLFFLFAVCLLIGFGTELLPQIGYATLLASLLPGVVWLFTLITAVIFPYTAKRIWETSPGAKYKIGGVPVVTITGVLGAIGLGATCIAQFVLPAFGIVGNPAGGNIGLWALAGYVALVLYYFAIRWYRAKHGIDISLAFKEVPPA